MVWGQFLPESFFVFYVSLWCCFLGLRGGQAVGTQDWESGAMAWDGGQPMDGFGRQRSVQKGGQWLGEPSTVAL